MQSEAESLLKSVQGNVVPLHLGIIMDGNRRFARRLMLQPWKGHEWGADKVEEVMRWCIELNVRTVTLYTLSLENLTGRPPGELNFLFHLMAQTAKKVLENPEHDVHKNKTRVRIIGRKNLLPPKLQELLSKVEEVTKNYDQYNLNFAVAYGGRQEIVDAFRKMINKIDSGELKKDNVDEETIKENLYTADISDPDFLIRTGGERRLSNFMLFQSAYAELYFLDTFWPEFSKEDFLRAIWDFQQRKRRFGK